ncbi:MAG: amidase [Alphaproteobacteria bacterium]|nr:amidase [Alphaproteobacteria bacterium]
MRFPPVKPTRRAVLTGLGAAAGAALLPVQRVRPASDPGPSADWAYRSAAEQIAALAERRVSSLELTEAAIARIEALDSKINAVVVRDFDRARAAAKEADAALARGERQPLLGLPMTVKEQFRVAGLRTTWGIPSFREWTADSDSLVITRLKAAGAVILGKTNVPFMLQDWQSYNDIYGTTNNPWDLGRTPGGSSGGSAAALAMGYVPLELGSDIGGSLRAPAHYCGVFAHKPSLDLVPQRGSGPPATPAYPVRGDLAVIGPMARSAADLALELDAIAGPDEMSDGIAYRLALPPPRHDRLADFRVLLLDTHPLFPTADSVRAALDGLADRLGKAGVPVARETPLLPDLAALAQLDVELRTAGRVAEASEDAIRRAETAAKNLPGDDESLAAYRLRGRAVSHRDWLLANRRRSSMRAQWRELFTAFDVVLCPPMPTPAFPHDHTPDGSRRRIDVDGRKLPYADQIVWASPAILLGLPATVAPIEHPGTALPIGVQIVGPYLEDRMTIAFAGMIEREFGGFVRPAAA